MSMLQQTSVPHTFFILSYAAQTNIKGIQYSRSKSTNRIQIQMVDNKLGTLEVLSAQTVTYINLPQ